MYTLVGEAPEFTAALDQLRDVAHTDGIEFDVADFGGVRTEADTERIMKYRADDYALYVLRLKQKQPNATPIPIEVWRPIAPFGSSYHNYGYARDVKIVKRPASLSEAECLRRLGSYAPACGLTWGGAFAHRVDPPHFQLAITLGEARKRWQARQPKGSPSSPEGSQ